MSNKNDEEKRKDDYLENENNAIKILVVLGLIVLIVFSTSMAKSVFPDQWLANVVMGVIGSLVASLAFCLLSETLFKDHSSQKTLHTVHTISGKMGSVQSELSALNNFYQDGLERIELIEATDSKNDLWIDLLDKSNKGLDIISHTLSPWFREKYADKFRSTIKSIIDSGGVVRIIVLDPDECEGINTTNQEKYTNKIRSSLAEMTKIANSLDKEKQKNLIIKLNSKFDISYAYIRNDQSTYVSPYLCSNDGRSSFITVFKNDSIIADGFSRDFDEIFAEKKLSTFDKNSFPVLDRSEYKDKKDNHYQSRTWNSEDTSRYVYRVGESLIEAGFYLHYMDGAYVESVIELSTSYGCFYQCKYCASSSIKKITPLRTESLSRIFNDIINRRGIKDHEPFILAMTGTGDYSCTFSWTNAFLRTVKKSYPNCEVILSSCNWNSALIEEVKALCDEGVHIKYLQWTYVMKEDIRSIIPKFPKSTDISRIIDVLAEATKDNRLIDKIRINYLMIKDVNDNSTAFEQFFSIIDPIKKNVLIRISGLNETNCSKRNKLLAPKVESLEALRKMCEEKKIDAYIFKSEKNDNMNCGQLITESE